MSDQIESVCIRCGKPRIFKKKWKEVLAHGNVIIHIDTVCPDSKCQAIVDEGFREKRERRLQLENKKTGVKI